MKKAPVGVIGLGNTAHALAVYLKNLGYNVIIYARNSERMRALKERGSIVSEGVIRGTFPIQGVTSDPEEFASSCSQIFVATTAMDYADVAASFASYLEARHVVILFSSKLFGSQLFLHVLRNHHSRCEQVMETDALFACRLEEKMQDQGLDTKIHIRGMKKWTLYSAPQKSMTKRLAPLLLNYFPGLEEGHNIVQRGLTDFGALAHATITLANLNKIDRQEPFLFYYEGLTSNSIILLEQLEREFQTVAQAYETSLIPMKELLNRYYGCQTENLLAAMTSVPCYQHFQAPTSLFHRYFKEDVACTLVPCKALALKAGLATPMLDAVSTVASLINGQEIATLGRSLERLGLENFTHNEIIKWMFA